jgi:predicted DNA-binding transcriptional regulator AlpA
VINVGRKLWTSGDVADRLGVSRQRALQIANDRREDFPAPFDELPGRIQVWLITDVEAWIAEHRPALNDDAEEA